MNANYVVKAGEFSYTRKARTIKAYGQEYPIPVRTVEFADKLDAANVKIKKCTKTSETVEAILEGIKLYIGKEETTRIFPDMNSIDVDEVLLFWQALNAELGRTQSELLSRYTPSATIRR